MSPQLDGIGSTPAPVCAEVRLVMDAVRDRRATTADRLFMNAHLEHCAGCASEWVFLQATKTAWAKTPMEMPSAALAARIAAATYRKPTLAQRLTTFFAFLQPIPVRVAIGVAAVAGVSFFALPRIESPTVRPVAESTPTASRPVTVIAHNTPKKVVPPVTRLPLKKVPVVSIAKSTVPKLVVPMPVREEKPTVAVKTTEPKSVSPKLVAAVPKSLPTVAKPALKPKPVQVATNFAKPVHRDRVTTIESSLPSTNPAVKEPDAVLAANTTSTAGLESPKPRLNTPAATPVVAANSSTAPELDPDTTDSNGRIRFSSLKNVGMKTIGTLSGGTKFVTSNSANGGIVTAPATF